MSIATTEQRRVIRELRRKLEHDATAITFMDRRLQVGEAWIGKRVDAWLDSLTVETASEVIDRLRRLAS